MKHFLLILAALLLSFVNEANADTPDEVLNLRFTPEQYDSLLAAKTLQNIVESYDSYVNEFISLDETIIADSKATIPDSIYEQRLKMMPTMIRLPYNRLVRKYIENYALRYRGQMETMMGIAKLYFPMIEEELYRRNMPLELKLLAFVESAMRVKAVSRAGATGMWQMMYATAKNYGLEINAFVDERYDVREATRAACTHLEDLYEMYHDWTLAIAAYNCGAGNVNKAIKRAGNNAKTFWDVYEYLPRETRGYVPAFIGATYAYTFHKNHGINPDNFAIGTPTDTIYVRKLTHFDQISSTIPISTEQLRELNPQYKLDIIPVTAKEAYPLNLPIEMVSQFIEHENEINAKDSLYLKEFLNPANFSKTWNSQGRGIRYKVKKGDTLGSLAMRHRTTTKAIMKANNLKDAKALRTGSTIYIP